MTPEQLKTRDMAYVYLKKVVEDFAVELNREGDCAKENDIAFAIMSSGIIGLLHAVIPLSGLKPGDGVSREESETAIQRLLKAACSAAYDGFELEDEDCRKLQS